jgi:hypothetical protein
MLPYEYAQLIVQAEKVGSREEYSKFVRKHEVDTPLPIDPSEFYAQWTGWSGFLGQPCSEEFAASYRDKLLAQLATTGVEAYRKTRRGASFLI